MIDTNALRKKVLDLAIRGKLVPQNPEDEPASVLLERIREEKQRLIREGKIKKDKVDSIIFRGDDNCHYEKCGDTVKKIDLELPEGWQFCRLSLVCWLNNGEKTSGEKLPYLDARTLRGKTEKTIVDNGIIVSEGEKVILVDGENSGEVFIVPFRGYMGSTFKILQMVSLINVEFIKVILDYYKEILKESKTGAAIPHLNKQLLKSIIIGVPPIEEQDRIVIQVQQIMQYIDLLENNQNDYTDLVESLKKAILQSAIQGTLVEQCEDDEPASVLLEKIRAEKKAQLGKKYVESYICKGSDNRYYEKVGTKEPVLLENMPFEIPSSWAWARLSNAIDINPRNNIADDLEVAFVEMRAIKDGFNNEFSQEHRLWKTVKKGFTHFQNGDIGFAKITPCFENRKSVLFDGLRNGYGAGTTELHILRSNKSLVLPDYILYFVKSQYLIDYGLKKYTGNAGQQRFGTSDVKQTLFPIPPYNEQIRICNRVKQIFDSIKDEV